MHNVLLMYKQLSLQFDEESNLIPFEQDGQAVYILSYDEQPDLQALAQLLKISGQMNTIQ